MLLSKGALTQGSLKDEVAIVTGAGRGIGYEAARGLIWLGANVVIAEVNEVSGRAAAENLEEEFGEGKALFVKTDVGRDKDIEKLAKGALRKWAKLTLLLVL